VQMCLAFAALVAAVLLVVVPVRAGELTPEASAALQQARSEFKADREKLLEDNLDLTAGQAGRFWPIYREFAARRAALGDQQLDLIVDYAKAYPSVSETVARNLVARSLKVDRQAAELRERYAKKLGKVLTGPQLMRFLQIERRIDNLVQLEVQGVVPIVDLPAQ